MKTQDDLAGLQELEYFDLPTSSLYWILAWFLRVANLYLDIPISSYSISSYRGLTPDYWTKYRQNIHARASPWK